MDTAALSIDEIIELDLCIAYTAEDIAKSKSKKRFEELFGAMDDYDEQQNVG